MFQLDRFIPISKLKYYFAVDTVYVGKKLGLLVFPYMHEVSPATNKCYACAGGRNRFYVKMCRFVSFELIRAFLKCSMLRENTDFLVLPVV